MTPLPELTSESLLESLLSTKQSFMSTLNYDKVLIGIVLGYGVQNSLYHSRMENILEAALSQDEIPFSPRHLSCHDEVKKNLLLFRTRALPKEVEKKRDVLEPSFGFSSLEEEIQELSAKFEISSKALTEKMPNYVFGNIKGHGSKLLRELEQAQNQIQTLLSSQLLIKLR